MNSSEQNNENMGQAIAAELHKIQKQEAKNMAKADKRKQTMLKNAAEKYF